MQPVPDRPFVASDATLCIEIERWLDRQGFLMAYGPQSGRADRGDALIVSSAADRPSGIRAQLEAA